MADHQTGTQPSPRSRRRSPAFILLPLIIFSAIAAVFWLALQKGDPGKLPSTFIGRQAPEVSLPPLDGLRERGAPVPGFSTSDLHTGTPTLVNFFASWCGPCVQEHPLLMQLAKKHGLRIHGVNYKDPPPGGRRFLGRYGNPYKAVGTDANGRVAIEWGVYGMPETFLVDGSGKIVFKHVGPLTSAVVEMALLPVLSRVHQSKVRRSKAGQ